MNIEIEELGNVLGTKNSLNKTSYKRARKVTNAKGDQDERTRC